MRFAPALAVLLALAACTTARLPVPDQAELATLYEQDQAARRGVTAWDAAANQRDAQRRQAVARMLAAGQVRTGADHYHAAMILQHGDDSLAYQQAHTLAARAVALGYDRARWLSAAAFDRWLVSRGRPQHYGTQFKDAGGVWYLQPIDSLAVTDAQRRALNVPTLDSLHRFLARKNGTAPGAFVPPPVVAPREVSVEIVGGVEGIGRAVVYPEAARQAGAQGRVLVELDVQPDGTLASAVVIEGLGYGLDEAVLRAVRAARYVNHTGEQWPMRIRIPVAPR